MEASVPTEKRHSEDNDNEDGHEEKRQKTSENQFVPTAGGLNNAGAEVPFFPSKSSSSSQPDTRKMIEQLHPVTGEVLRTYPAGSDAAKFMSISQGGISLCCHGKQADANGFCWRFYDGPAVVWDAAMEARQMPLEQLKVIQQQKLKATKSKEGNSLGYAFFSMSQQSPTKNYSNQSFPTLLFFSYPITTTITIE